MRDSSAGHPTLISAVARKLTPAVARKFRSATVGRKFRSATVARKFRSTTGAPARAPGQSSAPTATNDVPPPALYGSADPAEPRRRHARLISGQNPPNGKGKRELAPV
jgi:hypothetical protein